MWPAPVALAGGLLLAALLPQVPPSSSLLPPRNTRTPLFLNACLKIICAHVICFGKVLAAPGHNERWAPLDGSTLALLEPLTQTDVDEFFAPQPTEDPAEEEEGVPTTPVATPPATPPATPEAAPEEETRVPEEERHKAPQAPEEEAPGEEESADQRWNYPPSYARPEMREWRNWFPPGWQGTASQGAWLPEAEAEAPEPQAEAPEPPPQCPYPEGTREWLHWMDENWESMPYEDPQWLEAMAQKLEVSTEQCRAIDAAAHYQQKGYHSTQQHTPAEGVPDLERHDEKEYKEAWHKAWTKAKGEQHAPAEGVPDLDHHDVDLPDWAYRPEVEAPLADWLHYGKVLGNKQKIQEQDASHEPKRLLLLRALHVLRQRVVRERAVPSRSRQSRGRARARRTRTEAGAEEEAHGHTSKAAHVLGRKESGQEGDEGAPRAP